MSYAIFDVETRIDKRLLNQTLFRGRGLDEQAAFEEFRQGLIRDRQSDFFPLSFHVPISIAIGHVDGDRVLERVESLGGPEGTEGSIVREFWERIERFSGCLVSFNGRRFDLPVLELAALRYGCAAPRYFDGERAAAEEAERRSSERSRRHRYSEAHYDLLDFLTNFGAVRFRGGFDLLLRLIGIPGKGAIDGSRVQELWEAGRLADIDAYCRRDVVQTYFLFLRLELVRGRITAERHAQLLERAAGFRQELESGS